MRYGTNFVLTFPIVYHSRQIYMIRSFCWGYWRLAGSVECHLVLAVSGRYINRILFSSHIISSHETFSTKTSVVDSIDASDIHDGLVRKQTRWLQILICIGSL